jgi:hypothetical protein
MVLGSIPRTDDRAFESAADRIAGVGVTELHAQSRRLPSIYSTVRGRGPRRAARVLGTGPTNVPARNPIARPSLALGRPINGFEGAREAYDPGPGDVGPSRSASEETPPEAALRRRWISVIDSPLTSSRLSLLRAPRTHLSRPRGTPRWSARIPSRASFASPPVGGARQATVQRCLQSSQAIRSCRLPGRATISNAVNEIRPASSESTGGPEDAEPASARGRRLA